jgi:putative membrane protein
MIDYDTHNWLSHLLDIKGSMVREILGRVLTCVAWSAVVVGVHKGLYPLAVPSTVHALVGVALGLLLVFRTNASYDRFWEGRKLWGGIVNGTRNLVRGGRAFLKDDPATLAPLVRWTIAYPYAVMNSLRGRTGLGPIARDLAPDEVAAVLAAPHLPSAVAERMTACLVSARDRGVISDIVATDLGRNIQRLIDSLGGCERIHKTPLPFAYVVHLRRALILYCFTLPFALVGDYGWGAVLDTLMVAYIFFGIEEIGVEIEDPFGLDDNDLPLEAICESIQGQLGSLVPTESPVAAVGEGDGPRY